MLDAVNTAQSWKIQLIDVLCFKILPSAVKWNDSLRLSKRQHGLKAQCRKTIGMEKEYFTFYLFLPFPAKIWLSYSLVKRRKVWIVDNNVRLSTFHWWLQTWANPWWLWLELRIGNRDRGHRAKTEILVKSHRFREKNKNELTGKTGFFYGKFWNNIMESGGAPRFRHLLHKGMILNLNKRDTLVIDWQNSSRDLSMNQNDPVQYRNTESSFQKNEEIVLSVMC